MKTTFLSLVVIAMFTMTACVKENDKNSFESDLVNETETIRLVEAGFEIIESVPLSNAVDGVYTEGILEYKKDGILLGKFDFSKSDEKKGEWDKDGDKKDCTLEKKDEKYKKVIVEPLVKTDDCEYIVSGIIKYYDIKSGKWLATVDFGDGTCDDIGDKVDDKGNTSTFVISDWY
jgi:hypothetical protein